MTDRENAQKALEYAMQFKGRREHFADSAEGFNVYMAFEDLLSALQRELSGGWINASGLSDEQVNEIGEIINSYRKPPPNGKRGRSEYQRSRKNLYR